MAKKCIGKIDFGRNCCGNGNFLNGLKMKIMKNVFLKIAKQIKMLTLHRELFESAYPFCPREIAASRKFNRANASLRCYRRACFCRGFWIVCIFPLRCSATLSHRQFNWTCRRTCRQLSHQRLLGFYCLQTQF